MSRNVRNGLEGLIAFIALFWFAFSVASENKDWIDITGIIVGVIVAIWYTYLVFTQE